MSPAPRDNNTPRIGRFWLRGNQFDVWSYVHFFGAFFLAVVFHPLVGIIGTILWEVADGLFSIFYFRIAARIGYTNVQKIDRLFDKRGASWGDMLLGVSASMLWVLIEGMKGAYFF